MVMANVQTLLENADTPDLLNSVVNVILHIAKNYPNVFTSHFRVIIYFLYISTDVSFYILWICNFIDWLKYKFMQVNTTIICKCQSL